MINNYPTHPEEDDFELALQHAEELRQANLRRIVRTNQMILAVIVVASVALGYLLGFIVFSK